MKALISCSNYQGILYFYLVAVGNFKFFPLILKDLLIPENLEKYQWLRRRK